MLCFCCVDIYAVDIRSLQNNQSYNRESKKIMGILTFKGNTTLNLLSSNNIATISLSIFDSSNEFFLCTRLIRSSPTLTVTFLSFNPFSFYPFLSFFLRIHWDLVSESEGQILMNLLTFTFITLFYCLWVFAHF